MRKRGIMAELKQPKENVWLEKIFDIRLAIIEVRPGETEEEAWSRHLAEHPGDLHANIRVFNRPPTGVASTF